MLGGSVIYKTFLRCGAGNKFKDRLMSASAPLHWVLSSLSKFDNIKHFHCAAFGLQAPKAAIKGVLAGHTVAIVTYCVTKIITTCSPMIGQFFDTLIAALSAKEWL